jgi:hypothetical protein
VTTRNRPSGCIEVLSLPASVPLTELEPDVAAAVVAVLSRAGLPAVVGGPAERAQDGPGEVVVLVPEERREEALQTMAASMEAIGEELRRRRERAAGPPRGGGVGTDQDDDEEARPLLFERLRRLSFLPILLVPLLVVTLASVRIPVAVALVILIGGMAALHAWRDGRRSREG